MKKLISLFVIAVICSLQLATAQNNFGEPVEYPKDKILKVAFFSPLVGHLGLGYEQLLKPGISIDTRVGLIGVGVPETVDGNSGFYIGGGPKFMLGQDWHLEGMRQTHPLRGTYFKPELVFSYYRNNDIGTISGDPASRSAVGGALLLNFGKQWILADIISLNLSAGLGYGFGNVEEKIEFPGGTSEVSSTNGGYFYSHLSGGNDFPIAITSNFSIGLLIR